MTALLPLSKARHTTLSDPHHQSHKSAVIDVAMQLFRITESLFAGNKVDLGAAIYSEFGNDIDIFNTIPVNNSAGQYCNDNQCCFNGGIEYMSENRNTVEPLYYGPPN